jgi:hypothetical protein
VLQLKELAFTVSLLFATLARGSISVAAKGFTVGAEGEENFGLKVVTRQSV